MGPQAAVTSNCSSAVIIATLFSGSECTPACSQAVKGALGAAYLLLADAGLADVNTGVLTEAG